MTLICATCSTENVDTATECKKCGGNELYSFISDKEEIGKKELPKSSLLRLSGERYKKAIDKPRPVKIESPPPPPKIEEIIFVPPKEEAQQQVPQQDQPVSDRIKELAESLKAPTITAPEPTPKPDTSIKTPPVNTEVVMKNTPVLEPAKATIAPAPPKGFIKNIMHKLRIPTEEPEESPQPENEESDYDALIKQQKKTQVIFIILMVMIVVFMLLFL